MASRGPVNWQQPGEEPYGGLVEVWVLQCGATAATLAGCGVSAWLALNEVRFSTAWWILFLTTVISCTTELRFFLGHRNYLKRVLREQATRSSDRWRRARWDLLLMGIITTSKVFMAVNLANSSAFIDGFLCLMLSDLLWLRFEPRVWNIRNINSFQPCRWMWINLATAILILLGSRFLGSTGLELCAWGTVCQLMIGAVNCIMDLCCCVGPVLRPTP